MAEAMKYAAQAVEMAWAELKAAAWRDAEEASGRDAWSDDFDWTGRVAVTRSTGRLWFEVVALGETEWWTDAAGTAWLYRVASFEDVALGEELLNK